MLGMTQISTTAASAREAAREHTGQFGEQTHSAPEATLLTVADIEADIERREAQRLEREDGAKIVDGIRRAATYYATRRGQANDRDDIIGDTIVDVVGQQKRGTTHVTEDAFLQYSTRAVSSRYIDPNAHHTTLKARRAFNERTERFLQENGREMNFVERREIADQIRLAAPAGNRPAIGFEKRVYEVSISRPLTTDADTTLGDLLKAEDPVGDYATATTRAAAANDALEDETSTFRAADARKNIWNLLAEEGPNVAVKTLSDDREFRSRVAEFGGPAAVARAWQEGETAEDDPVNDALFAPFGKATMLTDKEREQITDVLLRNAGHADKIWDSAMTAALDVQKLRTIKRREARHAAREKAADAA